MCQVFLELTMRLCLRALWHEYPHRCAAEKATHPGLIIRRSCLEKKIKLYTPTHTHTEREGDIGGATVYIGYKDKLFNEF